MLSYVKYRGSHIPYTGKRYFFDFKGGYVVDNLDQSKLGSQDGYWNLPNTRFPSNLSEDELYLLTYKPMYMDKDDFFNNFRTNRINIIATPNTTPARNTRFWKLNVECSSYPGFYYIPGFTNYVISKHGKVISLITGQFLKFANNSTGYPACRMNRDDGKSCYTLLHTLLGLTFKDWDWTVVNLVIDHIDGDKRNYDLSNLEFVTDGENKRRAQNMGLIPNKSKPIYCYDLLENVAFTFINQNEASDKLNIPKSSIQNHLSKTEEHKLLHSRYFMAYRIVGEDGEYIDGYDFDNPESNKLKNLMEHKKAEGSQPKPVLMKCVSTGEIVEFPSVVNFIQYSGLTRKQVYPRLREMKQKQYGDIIFKYKDDISEWIK